MQGHTYMWHRYNTLYESSMYVVIESEKLDGKLDNREAMEFRCVKRKDKVQVRICLLPLNVIFSGTKLRLRA